MEDLIGNLIHELVWGQGLPNPNHRTTFALVASILERSGEAPLEPKAVHKVAESYATESKPLIFDKEFTADLAVLKEQHKVISIAAAKRLVTD